MLGLFQSSQDHRLDNAIDILLRELSEDGGGSLGLADQPFQVRNSFRIENLSSQRDLDPLLHCVASDHCLPPLHLRVAAGSRLRGHLELTLRALSYA